MDPQGLSLCRRISREKQTRSIAGARLTLEQHRGINAQAPYRAADPLEGRPRQVCTSRSCAASPPTGLTAQSAPVPGPPPPLRSCPRPLALAAS